MDKITSDKYLEFDFKSNKEWISFKAEKDQSMYDYQM